MNREKVLEIVSEKLKDDEKITKKRFQRLIGTLWCTMITEYSFSEEELEEMAWHYNRRALAMGRTEL